MRLTRLKIANLRAIEAAEFQFRPGFNLIVGVNGVGKTTVLDALRICMSRVLPSITGSRAKAMSFDVDDIHGDSSFLDVELTLAVNRQDFRFTRRQWRRRFAADSSENLDRLRQEILNTERLRDRARNLLRQLEESQGVSDSDTFAPSQSQLKKAAIAAGVATNCVYFSTNRSVASFASTTKSRSVGGTAVAYGDALVPRPMYVAQFADWMRVQETLAKEQRTSARHLDVLRSAIARFLPGFENLRQGTGNDSRLVIDKSGVALDVSQLSDGERGVLALVLDLARRLAQANPSLDDPLKEGNALVLIDEIDLHLHPKWQREIVRNLTSVFPRCQFIATTHSPQVIGEIEHDRIQIIASGQVYSPTHSFGVDSSRVLEEIMDARPRTRKVDELLSRLSNEIGAARFDDARSSLSKLVTHLGHDDPEVTRALTLIDFMEGEE